MLKFENLKLVCLDNDDTMFRSSPLISYHVDKNWPRFATKILKVKERNISIVEYEYNRILNIINQAKRRGQIPNIPNFNINRNDVIKTREERDYTTFEYEYYQRPLAEIMEALELEKFEKEMFLEERDATLEADGKLPEGVIPYHEIYQEGRDPWTKEERWFPYIRENINELHNLFGTRLISLTAHNGIDDMHGREFEAKGEAIESINHDLATRHYGLRFHATEHVPGVRRPRNSKASKIQELYGLEDLTGVVVLEDSKVVLQDILEHNGIPIWVNQTGAPNPEGFAMVKSLKAESVCRELERLGWSDNGIGVSMPSQVKKIGRR